MLFAFLVIACAGLLWATIAAAQHIRHARLRQRAGKATNAGVLSAVAPVGRKAETLPPPRLPRAKQLQSHF